MARYGKKAKKKSSSKVKAPRTTTPKQESAPLFDPSKFNEHMKSESTLKGVKGQIDDAAMAKMGFDGAEIKMMEDMSAIKSLSPFMTVAKCTKTMTFSKGGEKVSHQTLGKGEVYVMALGMYDNLRWSPQLKKDVLKPYKHSFADVFSRYEGHDMTDKTILIWRTGGIGDLLFIKPNMEYIKKTWPSAKIWFACAPSYQHMVKHWPEVDRLVDLPIDYYKIFSKADYHVTFEGAIERNIEAHTKNAYDMFSEWMGLNLEGDDLIPHQEPAPELLPVVDQVLKKWSIDPTAKDFILLQMQPSSPIRSIPSPKWVEVINELTGRGHKVIITDSPLKKDYVQGVIGLCENQDKVFNFAEHSETLDYTIALASRSKCTVGPDSSLCHISGSLDLPTFGIFGPFTGDIRLKYFPKARWIDCQRECAPCFLHGNDLCKVAQDAGLDYSPCLANFEANDVANQIEELISEFS